MSEKKKSSKTNFNVMSKKVKFYHRSGVAVDVRGIKRMVTVVGKFEQTRKPTKVTEDVRFEVYPGKVVDGKLSFSRKTLTRKFTLGLAICYPTDEFNEEIGIKLAKKRIEKGYTLGTVYTNDVTMLTSDACEAELDNKFNFIVNNIDSYLP